MWGFALKICLPARLGLAQGLPRTNDPRQLGSCYSLLSSMSYQLLLFFFQVLLLELGSPAEFLDRAVEPPPPKMLRAALRNLYDLQVPQLLFEFWCSTRCL